MRLDDQAMHASCVKNTEAKEEEHKGIIQRKCQEIEALKISIEEKETRAADENAAKVTVNIEDEGELFAECFEAERADRENMDMTETIARVEESSESPEADRDFSFTKR